MRPETRSDSYFQKPKDTKSARARMATRMMRAIRTRMMIVVSILISNNHSSTNNTSNDNYDNDDAKNHDANNHDANHRQRWKRTY